MIQGKSSRISIIIPVYNEEEGLEACLQAIAKQKVKPLEVIVVDNNSTDDTAAVAARFGFVKLLSEPRQGVTHARKRGFDEARGDIIARIDADTLVPADWTVRLREVFADQTVDAVSGVAMYYNVSAAWIFDAIDLFFRRRLSWQLKDRMYLWGANMAMRRKAWREVRSRLCEHGGIHEDYDIAIHLQELGGKVVFDERLRASVSSRRIDVSYWEFVRYAMVSPRTYAKHSIKEGRHMYSVVLVCAIGYVPARLLHRGYDSTKDGFSWGRLLSTPTASGRVDPTANVV